MSVDLRVPAAGLGDLDDATLAWRVIERVYEHVSLDAVHLAIELRSLTSGQRALLALHWCASETFNGGFDQFFTNPSRLLAEEAQVGFELLGVPEAAHILQQAQGLFAMRPAAMDGTDARFDEVEQVEEFDRYLAKYRPLEERFYAIVDDELYPRAAAYIRSHPQEFTT